MQPEDRPGVIERLSALSELYGRALSPAVLALYVDTLADLDTAALLSALSEAARTHTWMPKPSELRALVMGDSEAREESAWMSLKQTMRRAGAYASVIVDDAALAESLLALFGDWPGACGADLSPEMWAAKRKEFSRVYRVMLSRRLEGGRYLPGVCERANAGLTPGLRFVPVYRLGAEGPRALSVSQAEEALIALAVQAHGVSRLMADV